MLASYTDCIFTNRADFTALASSAAEGSLLGGLNVQPVIQAFDMFDAGRAWGKSYTIEAAGVFSTTGTPTLIFQLRLGETAGSAYLSGTSIGVSAAITTQSAVSNVSWYLRFDFAVNTPGIGTGNTTLSGEGQVFAPTGFASPFFYNLTPTTPPTGTWTSTVNCGVHQYLNLSATWSASSASNTITCKRLRVTRHN